MSISYIVIVSELSIDLDSFFLYIFFLHFYIEKLFHTPWNRWSIEMLWLWNNVDLYCTCITCTDNVVHIDAIMNQAAYRRCTCIVDTPAPSSGSERWEFFGALWSLQTSSVRVYWIHTVQIITSDQRVQMVECWRYGEHCHIILSIMTLL